MSDTRRRRKSHHSGGSEDLSGSYDELNATKETQSSEPAEDRHDSEYDTAGSDSDTESQDGALRESGDGQEEDVPQKKLDDDEDRRNPQYIPKRGTFYEHDDRTTDEVVENTSEVQNERDSKEKKVWKDKEDRWNHDRYNDDEQAPKSHEELIAVYGYDIRNEEGPPRARRRRRYGRGPNKYTRNWEDEDAYGKTSGTAAAAPPKSGKKVVNRTGEEFPVLGAGNNESAATEEPVISSAWYSNKSKSQTKAQSFPPLQPQQENHKTKTNGGANLQRTNENKAPNEPTNPFWKKEAKQSQSPNRSVGGGGGGGDADKSMNAKSSSRDGSNKRQVQESVSLAASRVRGRGFKANVNSQTAPNRPADPRPKGRGAGPISAENKRNNAGGHDDDQRLAADMKHMNVNDGATFHQGGRPNKNFYSQSSPGQQRPNAVPPRMQQQQMQQQQQPNQHQQQPQPPHPQQDAAGNRPKRYSSLRQRPAIQEGPAGQQSYQPPHGQQHGYYPPQGGNSRAVLESQGYPPGHFDQTPPVAAPPAAPLAAQPVIPIPPGTQAPGFAPPAFLVPSPQFMPPQPPPPSIINYVPGPNGPAFQPNFQGYQGYSPTPPGPPPPQELFQPQGCTYYSTAQQQQQQLAPIRRPKAAIPILPPPDNQQLQGSRGRGRSTQQPQSDLQLGNVQQQAQLEGKIDHEEGDGNAVPGQFDSMPSEQSANVQQFQRGENADAMTASVEGDDGKREPNLDGVESIAESTEEVTVSLDVVTSNDTPGTVIENTETVVSSKSVEVPAIAKAEIELTKTESAVLESAVVEEAAA